MTSPVVVGATGGSGTRVIARIVQGAGVFMGTVRNQSEDAMEFVDFYDQWINRFVARRRRPLDAAEQTAMAEALQSCVGRHCAAIEGTLTPWGWKEPRSLYLLPFLDSSYSALKFIHVVRDGRDMAFSPNQNQLRKHGGAILNGIYDEHPAPVRSAALWNAANQMTADYGEVAMGPRYLRIRFEDLCREPEAIATRVSEFVGGDHPVSQDLTASVTTPSSIGRWRTAHDADVVSAVSAAAASGLYRFGYCG